MSIYVKQFDATVDASFSGLVQITDSSSNIVVGGIGTSAIALVVDADGNVLDQLEFVIGDSTITFISVLPVGDRFAPGDYLLFGSKKVSATNFPALVIRVKSDGSVVWANTYGNTTTSQPLQIISSIATVAEERFNSFIFISKNITSTANEDIEAIRIDRFGVVDVAKVYGARLNKDQAAGLIPYENGGAIIYGGSNAVANFDSFFLAVDRSLSIVQKKLIGTVKPQEIRAVIPGPNPGDYIVAGDTGVLVGNKETFLFAFNMNKSLVATAKTYDLLPGADTGFRKLLQIGSNYYMFGYKQNGSYAAKFNAGLNLVWTKQLNITPGNYFLSDAVVDNTGTEITLCGWIKKSAQLFPLILRTDTEFSTCITLAKPNPLPGELPFTIKDWAVVMTEYAPKVLPQKVTLKRFPVPNNFICPAPSEKLNTEGLIQSPYIYIQAAGSNQADSSSKGVHLRWKFNKALGDNHFAKGAYANPSSPYYTTIGFNKANDYIKIYRAPYNKKFQAKVKFKNAQPPTTEINSGSTREWRYNGITLTNGGTGTTNVIVRFMDVAQYNTIRATMTTLKPENFMKQYTGIVEVETQNKLFFSAELTVLFNTGSTAAAYLRTEAISYEDPADVSTAVISCRKKFTGPTQLGAAKVVCESIKYLRLDFSIAYISEIAFETYYDYIGNVNNLGTANTWQFLGNQSLTLDTSLAYDRLENFSNPFIPAVQKYSVDKQWNKYNDSSAITGEFKVRVDNYKHRWYPAPTSEHPTTKAVDGIQQTIAKYLDYSKTDTKAIVAVPVEDDPGNDAQINISFFDILRLVGIDYHIARMMGLGLIDANIANDTTPYVYLMAYTSRGALETGDPSTLVKDHLYMTLPTTRVDYRLPNAPVQIPVSYGMSVDNGIGEVNQITDDQGYVDFDEVRFVNINRDVYDYEKPFGAFFADTTEFCLCEETMPVMYGLDYKGAAETVYRKPEITQDEEYFDFAGFNEVVEIPEQGQNPVYIHQEREEGVHCYAIYSINWFSRISVLSNQECTDYTKFKKIKNLLPPSNFSVQLIQKEEPLMFTTPKEQLALAALTTLDKTLVRATFEWNHNHNVNYQFAERAQLFYRDSAPDSIRGEIVSVTQLPDHKVLVKVKDYTILSTSPSQVVAPSIPAGMEGKYIGSLFSTGSQGFSVVAINNTTLPYAEFTLLQVKQTSSLDPLGNNQFTTVVSWLMPAVGDKFLVVENLAVDLNWSTHLGRTVYLEKFHTAFKIQLEATGTANNGTYKIEQVSLNGANTDIVLLDKLKSSVVGGNIRYERTFRLVSLDASTNKLKIAGNVVSEFSGVTTLRVFGSSYTNDKSYTISGAPVYNSPDTEITVTGPIADASSAFGYAAIEKIAAITALDMPAKKVTVAGDLTAEIIPPYIETKINYDSTETKFSYGGIYQPALVNEFHDPVTGDFFGAYTVKFNSYTLLPHIDPSVDWYKGLLRIRDTNTNLVSGVPQFTVKSLQVLEIKKDSSGNVLSPLELVIYDPGYTSDPFPIQTGSNVNVNFHPSYRLYLTAEFNGSGNNDASHQFNQTTMMPLIGDGSKITYMGIRSLDRVKEPPSFAIVQYESYIAPLVPVLAQEIVAPAAPKDLSGPLFATRPDFYKKSTYTVDIKLDTTAGRQPYGALVYRGSETKVLDTIYKQATLNTILPVIKQLKKTDTLAYYTMIHDLVNVVTDSGGNFAGTPNTLGFSFPLPDNADYIIPNRDKLIIVKPFVTAVPILGPQVEILRQAILGSFLSMTERPVVYKYVKGGITASGRKPIIRTYNGDIITPVLPEAPGYDPDTYDPHPMAVKFSIDASGTVLLPGDAGYSTAANDFYIRFTDFTLDGASQEFYFYYACEISNQLAIGPPSPVKAPVLMVNAAPAQAPGIREVLTVLANPVTNAITSVQFKLNIYNETEGITQFWIYRAYTSAEASNIRSMKLAKKIDVGDPVTDDFSDLLIPPYGETLFYKIVAVRRIQNELALDEDILSLPSNPALTNVVDVVNPQPPQLRSENGTSTPALLQDVILKWEPTAYNGTYYLQKLNTSGNWVEIYRIKVKDTEMQYPPLDLASLPDFTNFPETENLPRVDADGNPIYHRFRVQVENSSGLFNLTEFELTLAKGPSDLQGIDSELSYADGNGHTLPVLDSADFITGSSQPDTMTFMYLGTPLPAGHNSFVKIEVRVTDDLANTFTKTINSPGGSVTFNHGEGGLVLNNTNPNRVYTIRTKLFTDFAPLGAVQSYTLGYLAGPCYDLRQVSDIVKLTDGSHDVNPLVPGSINDGVAYPTQLQFTDISDLSGISETVNHIDITVTDDLSNTATKTIPAAGGDVTFVNGDGGLVLDNSNPNRSYEVKVKLFSNECAAGAEAVYNISYPYTPCDDLASLTVIAKYTDNNGTVINPLTDYTVTTVTDPNGSITLEDITGAGLPPGHTFGHMDVILEDDLGGAFIKTIGAAGGSVTFNNGDGGLLLDNSNPGRAFFVTFVLYTNLCSNGRSYSYTVNY
ncbi:MAG: hypothetical protein JWO44_1237 [Bacteroidetes bacterium]|nr:hypothetical protein [Bacteroidota bacterium]